jgi:hypothetical protein
MNRNRNPRIAAVIGAALVLAACGGGLYEETEVSGAAEAPLTTANAAVRPYAGERPASGTASANAGPPATIGSAQRPTDPYARTLVNPRADPKAAAAYLNGVNLFFDSREEILAAVAAYAAANPRLEIIRGYGWRPEAFDGEMPTPIELDSVVRDRPVILLSADLRVALRNSRGMAEPIAAAPGG